MDDHNADELLRRALIDADASAAVALRIAGLPLCETLTVVFHGRADLGTIQTYVAHGGRGAGSAVAADEVLDIWRQPLEELAQARVGVDRRIGLNVRLPAHRLLPAALTAPDKGIVVTAVCAARPLAEGKPPMGIACAQQDVARVYPLPDDPERCLSDFLEHAAEHARRVGEQLGRQAQSVRRFMELSGEGFADTA